MYSSKDKTKKENKEFTEIAKLVEIVVLEEDFTSEWASPTLAIAKKTEPLGLFLISENSTPHLSITHFQY